MLEQINIIDAVALVKKKNTKNKEYVLIFKYYFITS